MHLAENASCGPSYPKYTHALSTRNLASGRDSQPRACSLNRLGLRCRNLALALSRVIGPRGERVGVGAAQGSRPQVAHLFDVHYVPPLPLHRPGLFPAPLPLAQGSAQALWEVSKSRPPAAPLLLDPLPTPQQAGSYLTRSSSSWSFMEQLIALPLPLALPPVGPPPHVPSLNLPPGELRASPLSGLYLSPAETPFVFRV